MRHGASFNPPNRFESREVAADFEQLAWDDEYLRDAGTQPIEYLDDASQSIVSENRSPDLPFRYSINPYRGCLHGCSYCYARPYHEYLGFSAGLDFETKIVVKREAPRLLRDYLAQESWKPEEIVFSGVTDCYQPAEREFRLTRQCLEVALDCCQPVGVVTKNALIVRDLDLLTRLAERRLVHANISLTTLDVQLARAMEPRTSVPAARLRAIQMLSEAGIPTRVMVSPIIPGLNDAEIPAVLAAAKEAGAQSATSILLRLPLTVEPVFLDWLGRTQPSKARRVEQLIRQTRGGQLNRSNFGERMVGTGTIAEQVRQLFQLFARKLELDQPLPPQDSSQFQRPLPRSGQRRLF